MTRNNAKDDLIFLVALPFESIFIFHRLVESRSVQGIVNKIAG